MNEEKLYTGSAVELCGRERTLRLNFKTILEFKKETGLDLFKNNVRILDMEAEHFLKLVYLLIIPEDQDITEDEIRDFLNPATIPGVIGAVSKAFMMAMPEAKGDGQTTAPLPESRRRRTGSGSGATRGTTSA